MLRPYHEQTPFRPLEQPGDLALGELGRQEPGRVGDLSRGHAVRGLGGEVGGAEVA